MDLACSHNGARARTQNSRHQQGCGAGQVQAWAHQAPATSRVGMEKEPVLPARSDLPPDRPVHSLSPAQAVQSPGKADTQPSNLHQGYQGQPAASRPCPGIWPTLGRTAITGALDKALGPLSSRESMVASVPGGPTGRTTPPPSGYCSIPLLVPCNPSPGTPAAPEASLFPFPHRPGPPRATMLTSIAGQSREQSPWGNGLGPGPRAYPGPSRTDRPHPCWEGQGWVSPPHPTGATRGLSRLQDHASLALSQCVLFIQQREGGRENNARG